MSESVINVNNLKSGYANTHVLFGINFEAKKDNITVVVGPNGSGKSTLLKSIFGLCSVYSGEIRYKEDTITNMEPHDISRKKIAYLPQVNNVFANLTVKENLLMASYTVNSKKISKRIPEIFETFPILEQYKNTKADTLSGGQRQMLAMAMAIIRQPKVILFDEPTASLSPKLADEVLTKIIQIREDYGITVIMVEQNIRRALKMSDYVYLLANGKNVFSGKPDELLEHPELGKMYLGVN
ncbi:MAG: ABC transporter ATP-binding protein [Nitrosopumilus sp.]|nr:ABC transporter ATP-binding protein [Nitrosopumilus sp.]